MASTVHLAPARGLHAQSFDILGRQDAAYRQETGLKKQRQTAIPVSKSKSEEGCLLPTGAWDSHVHVVDEDEFPLHPQHPYRPKKATLSDLTSFHRRIGVTHACLVAFSVYQTDNRCLVDALQKCNGRGRGVACINPSVISDRELQQLHDVGVRAVRVNLKTTSASIDTELLKETCDRIRPYGWAVQLYISLAQIVELAPLIQGLGVPIVIDHIGAPDRDGGEIRLQKGYNEFMSLLRTSTIWTKLSGTYRFPDLPDLTAYILDVLRVAPDRVVWATDWPHSGGVEMNPDGDRTKVQEYRKVDDDAWVMKCKDMCDQVREETGIDMAQKIWVDNPNQLWQFNRS